MVALKLTGHPRSMLQSQRSNAKYSQFYVFVRLTISIAKSLTHPLVNSSRI